MKLDILLESDGTSDDPKAKAINSGKGKHLKKTLKDAEAIKEKLETTYSDALKKFKDGVEIVRYSKSDYNWREVTEPRERFGVQGTRRLGYLYNWFAVENSLPLRTHSIFGFTKQNRFVAGGVFGDNKYYMFPKNGAKLVCLRHDFNDDDSGILHDIMDVSQHYIKISGVNEIFHRVIHLFANHMKVDVVDLSDPHILAKVINKYRNVSWGDSDGGLKASDIDVDDDEPIITSLIKKKKVASFFDDIEAVFENCIDVKTPATVTNDYCEVFTDDNCLIVHYSVMDAYMELYGK
jgi:hypothetical protein